MIARNDDSPSGQFTPKKFVVVHPEEQPRKYKSVLSHVEIDLPEEALRYTAVPNALEGRRYLGRRTVSMRQVWA